MKKCGCVLLRVGEVCVFKERKNVELKKKKKKGKLANYPNELLIVGTLWH